MKATSVFLGAFFALLGVHGTTIHDVLVRQMWPWNREVVVEFVVRDRPASGYEQAVLTLSDGATALGTVPEAAFTTERVLSWNGKKHVAFDPAKVPALAGRAKIANLNVVVTTEPIATADEVLYEIFDLTKRVGQPGALTLVTASALTNGVWGAWSPHYWTNVTAVATPVWLAVTNDVKWCTTHLVMRRIPAGTFQMGRGASEDIKVNDDDITPPVSVTISKPYLIGVFPMTMGQYRKMNWGNTISNEEDVIPDERTSCNRLRGTWTAKNALYDWPNEKSVDPNSLLGHLRTMTGRAFDLPTEAQWEKAARAGSNGVYYDGSLTTDRTKRMALAWCYDNAVAVSNTTTGVVTEPADLGIGAQWRRPVSGWDGIAAYYPHRVGGKKPNNYGLYDTLGGVYEMVLDWQAGNISTSLARTDPEGAAEATYLNPQGVPKRVCKGGNYIQNYNSIRLARRCQNPVSSDDDAYGCRLCCPVE